MKVLVHGDKNRHLWWLSKQFTCFHCGCVFMLEDGDAYERQDDQRNGEFVRASCPECDNDVTVSR